MAKRHGWLVGALTDAGYQQRDLAKAWKVDDAVVSRFVNSGKPDLTPERQMMLSQMLNMTNDQLLSRLYGDVAIPGVLPLRPQQPRPPGATQGYRPRLVTEYSGQTLDAQTAEQVGRILSEIRGCVDRLAEVLPGVTVSVKLNYGS